MAKVPAVQLGAAALALPAGAALALAAARGEAVLSGPGREAFLTLALTGAAGIAAVVVAGLREARRAAAPASAVGSVVEISASLGDAVLLLDGGGGIVSANEAAARLAGVPADRLAGRSAAVLGPDLPVLARGLPRAAAADVQLETAAGRIRARAAVLAVAPALAVVVLRPLPAPPPQRPPPLPRRRSDAVAAPAALAEAIRAPLARAATATSLLRLSLPGGALADRELRELEAALADADRRLAALDAAGRGAGRARPVEVASVLADLLGALELPAGVRLQPALAPGLALADEPRLRRALREVLREALEAMPHGGDLAIAVAQRGGELVVEVSDTGAATGRGALPLARALLGEAGGRLEREAVPGRGTVLRIALRAAVPENERL